MEASQSGMPAGYESTIGPHARALVLVAILGASGLIFALFGAPPSIGGSSGVLLYGVPLSPQTCTKLESSESLDRSLAGLYDGYSLQGYAGPNGTPALGISSYPNLTAGQAALNTGWTSICRSSQFGYAYAQANGSSGFFSGGELALDGHYVFFYGFSWQDACPGSTSGTGDPCEATATWTIDLVTDSVSGPSFTNQMQIPLGGPPRFQ